MKIVVSHDGRKTIISILVGGWYLMKGWQSPSIGPKVEFLGPSCAVPGCTNRFFGRSGFYEMERWAGTTGMREVSSKVRGIGISTRVSESIIDTHSCGLLIARPVMYGMTEIGQVYSPQEAVDLVRAIDPDVRVCLPSEEGGLEWCMSDDIYQFSPSN